MQRKVHAYYFDFDLKESLNYIASSTAPGGMWKSEKSKTCIQLNKQKMK
jgi:hypothetical protein